MNRIKGIPIAADGMLSEAVLSHGNALPLLHEIEILLNKKSS